MSSGLFGRAVPNLGVLCSTNLTNRSTSVMLWVLSSTNLFNRSTAVISWLNGHDTLRDLDDPRQSEILFWLKIAVTDEATTLELHQINTVNSCAWYIEGNDDNMCNNSPLHSSEATSAAVATVVAGQDHDCARKQCIVDIGVWNSCIYIVIGRFLTGKTFFFFFFFFQNYCSTAICNTCAVLKLCLNAKSRLLLFFFFFFNKQQKVIERHLLLAYFLFLIAHQHASALWLLAALCQ